MKIKKASFYVEGILQGQRTILSQAITLVEGQTLEQKKLAQEVLQQVLPHTGKSLRLGISGIPGAGKSTLIDVLGKMLTKSQHKVAVLAVDPSGKISGGSILGDKTRMQNLAQDPQAFIRPSPSSGYLGGVGHRTRESILLCEAAGFDIILVETVGVGQSEVDVAAMVDMFVVLVVPGTGDELQGIKRGIFELADLLIVHKADKSNNDRALLAQRELISVVEFLQRQHPQWTPPVLTCSSTEKLGLEQVWEQMVLFQQKMQADGSCQRKRLQQNLRWFEQLAQEKILEEIKGLGSFQKQLQRWHQEIGQQSKSPLVAALEVGQFLQQLLNTK